MYRERGADTWLPFKGGELTKVTGTMNGQSTYTVTVSSLSKIRMLNVYNTVSDWYAVAYKATDDSPLVQTLSIAGNYPNLGIRSITDNVFNYVWNSTQSWSWEAWGEP